MKDKDQKWTYFEHMSEAYAKHCIGHTKVITDADSVSSIPQDGIWGTVEQKVLKTRGSGCTKVRRYPYPFRFH